MTNFYQYFDSNDVLHDLGFSQKQIDPFLENWQEPHRFYHTLDHLEYLLKGIESRSMTLEEKHILKVVALFHDIVYNPRRNNNEDLSAQLFNCSIENHDSKYASIISDIILDTATHEPSNILSRVFCDLDMEGLTIYDPVRLLKVEFNIFKEFQFVNFKTYINERKEFLEKISEKYLMPDSFQFIKNYLNHWRPNIGIYAGTFNPFHVGHLNILEKAEKIFDKVIVAVGRNPDKPDKTTCYDMEKILPFHEIIHFNYLLPELVEQHSEYANITLIKGLRSGYDLNYEVNQLRFMEDFNPNINIVYIECDREHEHISSSALRGLSKFSNNQIERYLPHKYDYIKAWER